ncbi:DUF2878 family protein [Aliamphritea spongicola]|nr:DUF2878 family protein [Aliamphritea spongicola]
MDRNVWHGLSENIWVNLLWFQLLWWLSILQTDSARWPVLLLLVAHLLMHRHLFTEALVITACGCLGFIVDSFLTLLGFFRFSPIPCYRRSGFFCFGLALPQPCVRG